ncbi:MAG: hypothetical protein M5U28_04750 [Sandaracinaceae bacterium]|nr:hypothetical protein [Sandaracinaceae bacterium]
MALRSETIAPGLYRLIPETERLAGSYALSGVAGSPQLVFRRAPLAAPPAVPALERAERHLVASGSERRLEVRATFGFPIPEDVVAVVSYWGDDDAPDAFTRAAPTQRSLVLFTSGECDPYPDGTRAPPQAGRPRARGLRGSPRAGEPALRGPPHRVGLTPRASWGRRRRTSRAAPR